MKRSRLSRREFLRRGACLVPVGALRVRGELLDAEQAPSGTPPERRGARHWMAPDVDLAKLQDSVRLACAWIRDIAQMKADQLTMEKNSHGLMLQHWKGAIRGEYSSALRQWDFFCPIWHTGQAIKALLSGHQILGDPSLLEAAKLGAHFIGRARIADPEDKNHGLIFGFEDRGDEVNTSAVLECLDGLLSLAEATAQTQYAEWAEEAVAWIAHNAYLGKGLFRDSYSVRSWSWVSPPWSKQTPDKPGRPLIDDAIFLKVFHRTGNREYRQIFYETANRLLEEEEPPGYWIGFAPSNSRTGFMHPRQAYWWGYPLIAAYKDSGQSEYLHCATRAGQWYLSAMRNDGGLFRGTYRGFKTDSFGQETSGIACAVILWHELWKNTAEDRWLKAMGTALNYCMKLQFREPADPNLKGAILEKVLPPDGTDRSPYHLRDLGTIFFIQAAAGVLAEAGEKPSRSALGLGHARR